ncbi:hypothetical protein KAH81_04180 [bacterium]|nr:hypothetical protein [bacterium]
MRVASIDIGTNSILMTIAEIDRSGDIKPLFTKVEEPRLGRGLLKTKIISESAIEDAVRVLDNFKKTMQNEAVQSIIPFGTEVFRKAKNAPQVVSILSNSIGHSVRILTPKEEAYFSYLGSTLGLDHSAEKCVFDVGGGSTEIIWGSTNLLDSMSIPIGAVVLTEKMDLIAPFSIAQLNEVRKLVDLELQVIPKNAFKKNPIGVGGSITTLGAIFNNLSEYIPEKVHHSTLDLNWITRTIDSLALKSQNQIGKIIAFAPKRATILPAGAIIIERFLMRGTSSSVIISDWGARIGILISEVLFAKL